MEDDKHDAMSGCGHLRERCLAPHREPAQRVDERRQPAPVFATVA
jgi:hypothetical protein